MHKPPFLPFFSQKHVVFLFPSNNPFSPSFANCGATSIIAFPKSRIRSSVQIAAGIKFIKKETVPALESETAIFL